MIKKLLPLTILFVISFYNQAQTVSDADGNQYNTVTIGTQIWMKENLKTTKYNDNSAIPKQINNTAWAALNTPAYCWYNNDSLTYKNPYGALYNWYAVNTSKLCPIGWHVPTNIDWNNLTDFLGGTTDAGSAMREIGTTHWTGPNSDATNSSGFTALPAGFRMNNDGTFSYIYGYTAYWTSNEDQIGYAPYRLLSSAFTDVKRYSFPDEFFGFSVRCLSNSLATQIEEKGTEIQYKISPNPASDKITIICLEQKNSLSISDITGATVFQTQLRYGTNEIPITKLPRGIYCVKIEHSKGIYIQKLVKN